MFNPPDSAGYNTLVYGIVRQIPPGRVSTYGQIASMIPPPVGIELAAYVRLRPRWVGRAMRSAPVDVPWQRVINSQGMISLPAGSPGADEQRVLLEAEGVQFDARGRVDFSQFGWEGPAADWLRDQELFAPQPLKTSRRK